ncbi:hypothetical protein EFQ23_04815 [Limosilactobacillus fermentum]|uniref:hypothetical protein n=1 Tax=Limosilactobacillus fermentum TaxID=1613 RepID=UPI00070F0035|nr:hypothetical protein [Limosilactobacillus fermentum]KRN13826.1 hypothetical protein IV46_GL000679 [Limosilactobacillus fermentum]MCH5388938.1 hypothetical protein [Limosilactobacillus fermentum]MCH5393475.1 hypothetical protein [Limosilactobacillus fermentum]MCT3435455.1 hypothetical protein [Limosilactobacillus fermentum]
MANEMTSHGFDDFLNDLEKKITVNNRRKINKAGADVYEKSMQQFLDEHRRSVVYLNGQQHLADTLTHEIQNNGAYEIGFSRKGKKAYIARLLNDGWDVKNRYGGPWSHAQPEEWHDFISKLGDENDERMGKAMADKARNIFRPGGEG